MTQREDKPNDCFFMHVHLKFQNEILSTKVSVLYPAVIKIVWYRFIYCIFKLKGKVCQSSWSLLWLLEASQMHARQVFGPRLNNIRVKQCLKKFHLWNQDLIEQRFVSVKKIVDDRFSRYNLLHVCDYWF